MCVAIPLDEENVHIVDIEYSPLIGGFVIVLNDGRAAFLTASSLKFDPNVTLTNILLVVLLFSRLSSFVFQQVQGIWAQGIEDASCAGVNHKYRLLTFGRSK